MKTKLIPLFLLIISAILSVSCNETPDEDFEPPLDFEFSIDNNGEASITGYTGDSSETVTIPTEYDGHIVTSIADEAFADNTYLRSIVIPESVTGIGSAAFSECINLESVEIGKEGSTVAIGERAFEGCVSLKSVIIKSSVSMIPQWMFANCTALQSFDIPEGTEAIGSYAFFACLSIAKINIPESVTDIGTDAFRACKALKEIHLPEGLTNIRFGTFALCESLSAVTIPESVTGIGANAFIYCDSLETVHIPKNVAAIDYASFGEVFSGKSLRSVTVSEENTHFFASGGLLYETKTGNVIGIAEHNGSVVIPEGVVNAYNLMSEFAVSLCIPASLEYFYGSFQGLESIEVSFDNDVYRSESGLLINSKENFIVLYAEGSKADTVVIPDGIGIVQVETCFDNADYVEHIVIGDVEKVWTNAFTDMKSLTDITFKSADTELAGGDNAGFFRRVTIYAPIDSKAYNYAREKGWNVKSLTE